MRKHDVRKWLHAILDLLPVILIPVFMVYSHRHDVAQDFEVTEQVPAYYQTNDVSNINSLQVGYAYKWNNDYESTTYPSTYSLFGLENTINLSELNIPRNATNLAFNLANTGVIRIRYLVDSSPYYVDIGHIEFSFVIRSFNSDFSYTTNIISHISSTDELIPNGQTQSVTTLIPKDVMTSFMDRLNNAVDKYFNFNNVANFQDVQTWFVNNIFAGNPPQVFYIVWNIVLYEFIMDLIFLTYMIFMFIIDFAEHLIECFFDKSYKGGK